MDVSTEDIFQTLKNRTFDENSKKTEKRNSLEHKRKSKQILPAKPMDMKPVKVLVERTKFNEMQVLEHSRSNTKPYPLSNGSLEKKHIRKPGSKSMKSEIKKVLPYKTHIDGLFRIRRCYVKIPKDKVLIRQLAKFGSSRRQPKRPRGRPKKARRRSKADTESSPTSANTSDLKRKITSDGEENSPSKRKSKVPGFFINISALTRTPSPRRKFTTQTGNDSPKRAKPKMQKPVAKKLNLVELRRNFGTRFFKSYVKVQRFTDDTRVALPEQKKKSGKNLTVSFLETVEIFGESTDSEEWMDYEGTPSPVRASRLKPLENGDNAGPTHIVKAFSTSTPSADGSPNTADSFRKKGGILKRKEKISFSPLKEDEISPRKEQLKRSNEKIVRLSFEEQCADEDGQPETTAAVSQSDIDKVTPADATPDADKSEDDRNSSTEAIFSSSISPEKGLMTPMTPPPPSAEKDDSTEREDVPSPTQQETRLEDTVSLTEKDERPLVEKSIESEVSVGTSGKDEESFQSAEALTSNLEEKTDAVHDDDDDDDDGVERETEKLVLSDTENEENENPAAEVSTESNRSDKEPAAADSEKELAQQQQEESTVSEANQVNISNNSEQHFEDASDLVATVIMNNSTEADRHEAEAVLNDVCQIAAAESAALLDAADVAYNSGPNDDDDDDDFTSVLTHPEVERSLQSAASTLVPNSQEIVVAAAAVAASQVTDVDVDVDVCEDTFASVVAEVERFTKDDNPGIYSDDVGITGADVMMDNVQARNSLDIFDDDDVDDDIISSLRMSSGNIDIGHDKSLPIQVIETEVMAIPNEPDLIFDKPLGTTASILGTSMSTTHDTLAGHGHCSTGDTNSKLSLGRIFQSVKSYVMSPGGDKNAALQD